MARILHPSCVIAVAVFTRCCSLQHPWRPVGGLVAPVGQQRRATHVGARGDGTPVAGHRNDGCASQPQCSTGETSTRLGRDDGDHGHRCRGYGARRVGTPQRRVVERRDDRGRRPPVRGRRALSLPLLLRARRQGRAPEQLSFGGITRPGGRDGAANVDGGIGADIAPAYTGDDVKPTVAAERLCRVSSPPPRRSR